MSGSRRMKLTNVRFLAIVNDVRGLLLLLLSFTNFNFRRMVVMSGSRRMKLTNVRFLAIVNDDSS